MKVPEMKGGIGTKTVLLAAVLAIGVFGGAGTVSAAVEFTLSPNPVAAGGTVTWHVVCPTVSPNISTNFELTPGVGKVQGSSGGGTYVPKAKSGVVSVELYCYDNGKSDSGPDDKGQTAHKTIDLTITAAPAVVNGSCSTTAGACTAGTVSGDNGATSCNTTRTWSCVGSGGGTTASCSVANAACPVNGSCGTANGTSRTTAPSTAAEKCSLGTASSISGSGPWTWSCAGASGGSTASCSATLLTQPNLTAGSVSPTSATAGSAVTLSSTISNTGTGSTGASFTDLFQLSSSPSGTSPTDLGTYANATLASGGSNTATKSYTFSSAGTYYIRACADKASSAGTGTITESNESDNCGAWTAVTVGAAAAPDLTAAAVTPTSATVGTAVTLSSTISNGGNASTGASFTDLFQSATDSSGTGATDIGTYSSATIAANGSNTATKSYTFASAGTYYIRACADKASSAGTGTITESNESNNCSAWRAVTVAAAPQADLTAGATTPSSAVVGQSVSFSASASNTGNATSAPFPTRFQIADAGITQTLASAVSTYITLNANASQNVSASYTFSNAGSYNVRACANQNSAGDNIVAESNYGNNCGAWTVFTVTAPTPPSIASCTPSPSIAAPNQPVTWTVSTAGFSPAPTTYTWSAGGGNPSSSSGSATTFTATFAAGGGYSPTVSASNGSQSAGPTSCTPVTISGAAYTCDAGVSATISADPTRVTAGSSATITYTATGVAAGTSCTLTGPNAPAQTAVSDASCNVSSGSFGTGAISTQSVYTITCAGAVAQTAVVNVLPKFQEF